MAPVAILSSNTNPDYLSLLPIVCKSWEIQGFNCFVVINKEGKKLEKFDVVKKYLNLSRVTVHIVNEVIQSSNNAIYTQCCRLYSPLNFPDDTYCILSDVDMFICSSFLNRDFDKVNSFGHDLTGFGQIPMCYVGMTAGKWVEIMKYQDFGMEKDLSVYCDKDSPDWYKSWGADQDILTAKLKEYGFEKINFIHRGNDQTNSGLPVGRWDRYSWQKPGGEIHDCHLLRNLNTNDNALKIKEMCEVVYPSHDWSWLNDYYAELNG